MPGLLFLFLKGFVFVATVVLVWWAWRKISDSHARWLFAAMMVFFLLPMIQTDADDFPAQNQAAMGMVHQHSWTAHATFYVGQILYFFFLRRLIYRYIFSRSQQPSPVAAGVVFATAGDMTSQMSMTRESSSGWFSFLTDQGLDHILTIPFMILVVAGIYAHFPFIKSIEWKRVLRLFMLAMLPLIIIHAIEFFTEGGQWGQTFYPVLLESMEYAWYFCSLMVLAYAVTELQRLTDRGKVVIASGASVQGGTEPSPLTT